MAPTLDLLSVMLEDAESPVHGKVKNGVSGAPVGKGGHLTRSTPSVVRWSSL